MKPLPSDQSAVAWPHQGLAACALGVLGAPVGYLAMGALGGFAAEFSMIALPPLLASMGYAFYRALRRPQNSSAAQATRFGLPGSAGLVLSVVVIVAFLLVVSNFTLLRPLERLGLFCGVFLTMSALFLPIVIGRNTAISARIAQLPVLAGRVVLALIVLTALALAALNALRAPAFL